MIIGIDGNEANVKNRVGVGEYSFELLKQFKKFTVQSSSREIKFKIYLKNEPLEDMSEETSSWQYQIVKPGRIWTQIGLPLALHIENQKPDVFFSPSHYAPRFSPIPTVISIMDLSYIHFPHLFKKTDLYKLKRWTKYSVIQAEKVLTISNASKNDIIHQYHIKPEKIIVTYPGLPMQIANKKDELVIEKYKIKKPYILFVGTLQPRKNIVRLIEAFSEIMKKNDKKDLGLVVVGKKGWMYEEILQAPKKYSVEEHVQFLEFVGDNDLPALYSNASCFVLPSLYEGFGLPVLEAMSYECPVITSNISSLPEAGGDAALYVDPTNVHDIADKIVQVLADDKLRKKMIEKGKKQIAKFSWERTAKETLKVLEEVATKE